MRRHFECFKERNSVHYGHIDIQKHDIYLLLHEHSLGFQRASTLARYAQVGQVCAIGAYNVTRNGFVVDDEAVDLRHIIEGSGVN
ncbi:hypothetical protein D3C86_2020450 [compost metagenome]